jgi:hypothetical protein
MVLNERSYQGFKNSIGDKNSGATKSGGFCQKKKQSRSVRQLNCHFLNHHFLNHGSNKLQGIDFFTYFLNL